MSDQSAERPPVRLPDGGETPSFAWVMSQGENNDLSADQQFLYNLDRVAALRPAFLRCLDQGGTRGDYDECEYQIDHIMTWFEDESNPVFRHAYWLAARDLNDLMERHPDLAGYNHLAGHWAEQVRTQGGRVETR